MKLLDKTGFTLVHNEQKEAKPKVTGRMTTKNSRIISSGRFILAKRKVEN